MREGISERPDTRRVRRLNLSQEMMFPFLVALREISRQQTDGRELSSAYKTGGA